MRSSHFVTAEKTRPEGVQSASRRHDTLRNRGRASQALPAAQASGPGGMPVPQTSAAARGLRLCFVLQEYARPGILRPGFAQGIDPHRQGKGADVGCARPNNGPKSHLPG